MASVACAGRLCFEVVEKVVERTSGEGLSNEWLLAVVRPGDVFVSVFSWPGASVSWSGEATLVLASKFMGPPSFTLCRGLPVSFVAAVEGAVDARALRLLARGPSGAPPGVLAALYLKRVVEQGSSVEKGLASMVFRALRGEARVAAFAVVVYVDVGGRGPRARLAAALKGDEYCLGFFGDSTAFLAPCGVLEGRVLSDVVVRFTLTGEGVPRVELLDPKSVLRE